MLEVKDATIAVGGRTLAAGLSFTARDGQLTCVTGRAGSGKTTLLRTLLGFLPVAQGFVSVDGELLTVLSAHAFRALMVYLPQEVRMLGHQLSVPEAPVCQAEEYGVWNQLLPAVVPLEPPAPLTPEEVLRLAEQTIGEAPHKPIIIADEPAASLTPELAGRMLTLLREQASAGKTVLIASRNPLLVAHADQLISLDGSGRDT